MDVLRWILGTLSLGVVLAPIAAGLYGFLVGFLLSRSVGIAIGLTALFGVSYSWSMFAMISIQGWGE